jgi:hypothetical protein
MDFDAKPSDHNDFRIADSVRQTPSLSPVGRPFDARQYLTNDTRSKTGVDER